MLNRVALDAVHRVCANITEDFTRSTSHRAILQVNDISLGARCQVKININVRYGDILSILMDLLEQ